jgi:DNA-binding NarL/FixJ family response regulator
MKVATGSFQETAVKTCFRCGVEFEGSADRVCSQCRKPRAKTRTQTGGELTFRELQILRRVCQAKLNKEIAFDLRLTEGTIKEYMNRIFRKLDVKNRTELAMWGIRNRHITA